MDKRDIFYLLETSNENFVSVDKAFSLLDEISNCENKNIKIPEEIKRLIKNKNSFHFMYKNALEAYEDFCKNDDFRFWIESNPYNTDYFLEYWFNNCCSVNKDTIKSLLKKSSEGNLIPLSSVLRIFSSFQEYISVPDFVTEEFRKLKFFQYVNSIDFVNRVNNKKILQWLSVDPTNTDKLLLSYLQRDFINEIRL